AGQAGTDGLDVVGAEHADGDDRYAGRPGEPGHPGTAPVEPPVGRAGALRVDGDETAGLEYRDSGVEGRQRRPPATALHPDRAQPADHRAGEPAAKSAAGEVLGLGPERDVPGRDRGEEQLVSDRQVVP